VINFKTASIEAEYISIVKPAGKSILLKPGENVKAQVVDILPDGGVVLRLKGSLVEAYSEIPLEKGTQLNLKILELTDKGLIRFQIIKDKKVLNIDITHRLIDNLNNKEHILRYIQSFSVHKNFTGNFLSIYNLSQFEKVIKNTGILFERKLLKGKDFKDDFKFKLISMLKDESLSSEDKKKVKKLIQDIQYYQYLSKINNVFWTFIPFIEKEIVYADFLYKTLKEGRDKHTCVIRLKLKNIGEIAVYMLLSGKVLNISFFSENKKFLNILKENISQLNLSKELSVYYSFVEKKLNLIEIIKNDFKSNLSLKA